MATFLDAFLKLGTIYGKNCHIYLPAVNRHGRFGCVLFSRLATSLDFYLYGYFGFNQFIQLVLNVGCL